MGIQVTHPFVSGKADGPDASLVRPSDWNVALTVTLSGALKALDPLAGLADRMLYFTGPQSAALVQTTAFMRGLLASADAAALRTALAAAPIASPAFTGTPTVPTAAPGTNTLQVANTAFVAAAIAALISSAPGALDTLDELAAALGDDANFAATITNGLALKAPLASPTFTGTVTLPAIAGTSDNSNKAATTAFVQAVAAALATGGFTTGDAKLTIKTAADAGWVMMNDGSVGGPGSAATTRANADTQALFTLMWTAVSDTWAPAQTSAGATVPRSTWANAATAFANNARVLLPRQLGRALVIAGAGTGLTNRVLGSYFGEESHTQTVAEMPAHTHNIPNVGASQGGSGDAGSLDWDNASFTPSGSQGGGSAMNVTQASAAWNIMIKL